MTGTTFDPDPLQSLLDYIKNLPQAIRRVAALVVLVAKHKMAMGWGGLRGGTLKCILSLFLDYHPPNQGDYLLMAETLMRAFRILQIYGEVLGFMVNWSKSVFMPLKSDVSRALHTPQLKIATLHFKYLDLMIIRDANKDCKRDLGRFEEEDWVETRMVPRILTISAHLCLPKFKYLRQDGVLCQPQRAGEAAAAKGWARGRGLAHCCVPVGTGLHRLFSLWDGSSQGGKRGLFTFATSTVPWSPVLPSGRGWALSQAAPKAMRSSTHLRWAPLQNLRGRSFNWAVPSIPLPGGRARSSPSPVGGHKKDLTRRWAPSAPHRPPHLHSTASPGRRARPGMRKRLRGRRGGRLGAESEPPVTHELRRRHQAPALHPASGPWGGRGSSGGRNTCRPPRVSFHC
ncbi:hypothetical protein NDU88_003256 [Pleurodeles waltl]|uniref:Uncharacterized protein n=1 Tax=Pleurodeles waltl TaxID=8319 RepID=A0AAV7TNH5_PLEWA|nr:hypothetical protein NDU88_003256 [Pleurodeles waltl]